VSDQREFTYFTDPQVDQLVSLTWQLAQELSVLRTRVRVLEEQLVDAGVLRPGQVDTAEVTGPAADRIAAERRQLVARLTRVLTETDDHDMPMRQQFSEQLSATK